MHLLHVNLQSSAISPCNTVALRRLGPETGRLPARRPAALPAEWASSASSIATEASPALDACAASSRDPES